MKIVNDLNLKKQAEELGVSVWRTPSFLFIVLGIFLVLAMNGVYHIAKFLNNNPRLVIVSELVVVIIVLAVGKLVINQVEQMAKLNKMKNEFISVASHQLRTPLSAIRWQTELLLSKLTVGLDDKQKEKLNNIDMLTARMTRLVNDLLDVARIDQGRLGLMIKETDINAIIKGILKEAILPLANEKEIKIVFDESIACPMVLADGDKMKMVFENLLSNSIKYTLKEGKVEINYKIEDEEVVFSIKDTGVGIPQSQQDQVFSKFFRSSNVVRYQTEGTGLGLYIAKSIVEQSGGKMWFESEENVGTTFYFSLPLKKV